MNAQKVVDTARGRALADEHGMQFFETCARDGINVEEPFIAIAREVKKRLFDIHVDPCLGGADAEVPVTMAVRMSGTNIWCLWTG